MNYNFSEGCWTQKELAVAYSFRFTETPDFVQHEDCIGSGVNENHREGFDNVSLLTRDAFGVGAQATIRCAFEGMGCPEIIIVEKMEACEDGAVRYGACFEIVLYKNGLNVWRHYREDGKCSWHKRLGLEFSVSENEVHELSAQIKENYLVVTIDNKRFTLRVDDLPSSFHLGITACEGIARIYEMQIENIKD